MAFIRIVEFTTSRIGEVTSLFDKWSEATRDKRAAEHMIVTRDRDRPNTYIEIVEFASYEDAVWNSNLPETRAIGAELNNLCDGEPIFRNLDILREERL